MTDNRSRSFAAVFQICLRGGWLFNGWTMIASVASWNEVDGVHGGGSQIMEAIGLNVVHDYEAKKNIAKYLADINEDLD